jgi:hypothetical protein
MGIITSSTDVSARVTDLTESYNVYPSRITIVSIPGLSFLELKSHYLADMPHIEALIANGAIAAMNIRAPEGGIEDTYISIGSSSPVSTISTLKAWQRKERNDAGTIVQQYARFHGDETPDAQIIIPDFIAMKQANNHVGSRGVIGSFGTLLQGNGVHTYVYGDLRQAPFMMMDQRGLVEYGQVGERLSTLDNNKAAGITTNYKSLLTLWQNSQSPAVIVLELGDLQRLYAEQRQYEPAIFEDAKKEVLQEVDTFIGVISHKLTSTDQLWIFSPLVNTDAWSSKWRFSPLLMRNPGDHGSSLIYSPSTHREGIVTMYDLAPTILRQFSISQHPSMIGIPLQVVPTDHTLSQLMLMSKQVAQVYKLRPQLLYPFVIYQIIVLLISLLMVLLQWSNGYRAMALPLYTLMISPLTMLLMGWLVRLGWDTQMLVTFFILFLFITSWFAMRCRVYRSLITICAITVSILFIDGFTGAYAIRSSVLGYDPLIGARYYGVGNEYMGVWIGAAILGVTGIIHYGKGSKITIIGSGLLFVGILFYMASPAWGTNAGGAITAGVAFGIAWLRLFSKRVRLQVHWRMLSLWIMLFVCLALLGLWLLNGGNHHTSNDADSHIGRAMDQLLTGQFDLIKAMMWRKLMMNVHLIGVSVWSKTLLASLIVMAVLLMKPAGLFRRWQAAHSSLMQGLSAIATGALIALLVNDSGIVAAATMMVFVAIPMLLIRLQELGSSELKDYSDRVSHSM